MPIRPKAAPAANTPLDPAAIQVRPRTRMPVLPDDAAATPARRAHHIVDRSGPNWDEHGDYLVGKGRPPVATRWQKGRSGNPRGPKPTEKLDPQSAFYREALAPVTARVNGEEVTLEAGRFLLQSLRAGVAKGHAGSTRILTQLILDALRHQAGDQSDDGIETWEQDFIDTLLAGQDLLATPVVRRTRILSGQQDDQ